VGGADLVEALVHDVMREFGAIAFAAQMGKVKVAQFGGHDLHSGFGGSFVGKMAVTAENALLERPRAARTILKHLHVVIGFEDEDIRWTNALDDQSRHVTEVGDEGDVAGSGAQQKADRVLGIVRDGKGVHQQVVDFKARAGVEEMAVKFGLQLKFKCFLRGAVAINRDVQFGGDSDQSLDVVGVFVRNENGGEIFRHTTDGGEPLADLARAEPGVHKDAGFIGFDVGAIAGGTAAEDGEFDNHEWTLAAGKLTGKFFPVGNLTIGK
jgi:hypothetical protein